MSIPAPTMPTVGEIARRLAEPVHRIEYILRTRNIRPAGIAGNSRVYAEEDVERIAAELQGIDARKDGGA
ncbi:MAG TPA: MerR family transcriptional regulator [Gemmataceae bacterium]|jgi:hypothetical protein